jgi:hypothetical protein
MQPTNNFFAPRRKVATGKPRGKRVSKTAQHLQAYLDLLDVISDDEYKIVARDAWMAAAQHVVEALLMPDPAPARPGRAGDLRLWRLAPRSYPVVDRIGSHPGNC